MEQPPLSKEVSKAVNASAGANIPVRDNKTLTGGTTPLSRQSVIPIIFLLVCASLSGYLFGKWQWSVLWPGLCLVGIYLVIRRRLGQFFLYHRNAVERTLARQHLERHVETVEWLNITLERIWAIIEPWVGARVTEKVNFILAGVCPGFLDSIELKEFTLGSTPPVVLSMAVHPTSDLDTIHMDAELCFIPNEVEEDPRYKQDTPMWNSKVVLAARVGKGFMGVDVPVMLKEVSFYAKLRIQLELTPTPPFMSKIQLAFLEAPRIDFVLKPLKSFDLMDMPGLSSWLIDTINGALQNVMVDPNMITIPLTRTFADVLSIGVLKIKLLQIRGLKFSSTNLPIVKVQIGGRLKATSRAVNPTTSEWDETFFVLVHNLKSPIVFSIMQGNVVTGTVNLSIADIEQDAGTMLNVWRTITVGPEGGNKVKGELNFGVQYFAAEGTPDPEADMNFESGIVQFTLHQLKDIAPEKDRKTVSCYYEAYMHVKEEKIDADNPPLAQRIIQSKPKKKTCTPAWDESTEIFLQQKSRFSITILIRDKDDRLMARWTGPFTSLINRTDWFQFEDNEAAQLFASFIFRPVRIDLAGLCEQQKFVPSLGMVTIRIVAATGVKQNKTGYYIAVDINGRNVGKTKNSLSLATNTPVWNKSMRTLVKDTKDKIHIELLEGDDSDLRGLITVPVGELLARPNEEIERNEPFKGRDGREIGGTLKFAIGIYPIKRPEHVEEALEEQEATSLFQEPPFSSNCGVLELRAIAMEGVQPTTTRSLHYCRLSLNNEDPCYETFPSKIAINGPTEWRRTTEIFIYEPELTEVQFTIMESHGMKEEFVDGLKLIFSQAQCHQWYKVEGITQGRIRFDAVYYPLPAILEAEQEENGLLNIQILEAHNLIAVDSGGTSDPFCVLRLNGTKFYKTKVVKKCLDPIFEESTEVAIKQKDVSVLQIELRDWNKVAASRTLGLVNVELQNIMPEEWQELELPLENVSSGTLKIRLNYKPEQTGKGPRRSNASRSGSVTSILENVEAAIAPGPALPIHEVKTIPEEHELGISETLITTIEGDDTLPGPPLLAAAQVRELKQRKMSTTTAATAVGVKFTINELVLDHLPSFEYECKLKVRKDGQTIFKTRSIKGKEHIWNEAFTLETATIKRWGTLTILPIWSRTETGEFVLDLQQLDLQIINSRERELTLPLIGSTLNGHLVLKYGFTNDAMNMVDTRQRRRFSFLGR